MAHRRTRLRIWCEDRSHEQFLRGSFTRHYGIGSRDLTFAVAPSGSGAASHWVAQQYQTALGQAKATKHQAQLGFLVVIDGDNKGPLKRKQEMFGGTTDNRDATCRLAIWVPTWSIETWVKLLSGGFNSVNDAELDVKKEVEAQWARLLPLAISSWDHAPLTSPSLDDARSELIRLPLE